MNTQKEKEKLETCIEIIEGIDRFQRFIEMDLDNISKYEGWGMERLIKKCEHNIDIYNRCIKRLMQRYDRVINS